MLLEMARRTMEGNAAMDALRRVVRADDGKSIMVYFLNNVIGVILIKGLSKGGLGIVLELNAVIDSSIPSHHCIIGVLCFPFIRVFVFLKNVAPIGLIDCPVLFFLNNIRTVPTLM